MTLYDYHTHTNRSDGKHTQQEMVNQAKSLGLKEFGISDHFCLHQPNWSMNEAETYRALEDLAIIKKKERTIEIKVGLEVDYIPGAINKLKEVTAHPALDYVIGAVHYLGDWNFDTGDKGMKDVSAERYVQYYQLIAEAADSGLFDFIAHFDLIKKFNKLPTNLPEEAPLKALDSIARNNIALEINTNGINKPCNAFYPAPQWLDEAAKRNIPMLISSDAHNIEQITQHNRAAREELKLRGITETVGFSERKRYHLPL